MDYRTRNTLGAAALAGVLIDCAAVFPRYTTLARTPPAGLLEGGALNPPPEDIRRLTFVSAELPPSRPDGHTWDDDGDPDLYAVLYRDGEEIYRTPVAQNTLRPTWRDASVTVRLGPGSRLRIELRDEDGVVDETVARAELLSLPEGADGVTQPVRFDNEATLQLGSSAPHPSLGMGVTYEVHESYLRVLEVTPEGPGFSAGLRPGDRILAIDGRGVADLGEQGSRQGMDRAALRDVRLTVQREGGATIGVDVRLGAVYPAR
jgi:hypothetical protein